MTSPPAGSNRPFRWDLVRPDQLGSLLEGYGEPDLWFLDELTVAAARVLARCADGQLHFVGRSADSVFDLLSGALASSSWAARLQRLPFSFRNDNQKLTSFETSQVRDNLTASALTPGLLARASRPVVFVDLVAEGGTFTNLYRLLRTWVDQEPGGQWDVVRRKLRFIGITGRRKTSPNTWRWQQHAPWTAALPASAVCNISIHERVWDYFGNWQPKLTRSFQPSLWIAEQADAARHDEKARQALVEAVALVSQGRSSATRNALVQAITAEPNIRHGWLRDLALEIRTSSS